MVIIVKRQTKNAVLKYRGYQNRYIQQKIQV